MRIATQLITGFILSGLIAYLAYRRGSLSKSGVVGAMIDGTLIFGLGGWVWGLLLIAFFVLSSLLSHYKESEKEKVAAEKFDKGNARDLGQALANGGAGALLAVVFLLYTDPVIFVAFIGAMATVNADTWATELGVLSRRPPRLLTTFKAVERGTSGGVSLTGTLATMAGGLVIGLAAWLFMAVEGLLGGQGFAALGTASPVWALVAGLLGGLSGSLFDSFLGATVQAIYFCPACQKDTEKTLHSCGTETQQVRGWAWLNNDLVNFISSLVGAGLAAALWMLFATP